MQYCYSNNGLSSRTVDDGYVAISGEVLFASPPTQDQIAAAFSGYTKLALTAYVAAARFAKETAGVRVGTATVNTDRRSQAQLTSAYVWGQANPTGTMQWKLPNGSFVALSGTNIVSMATAVAAYVQGCFAIEALLVTGINAGSITTTAQIDQANWPSNS